jgi:nucleotidyltransferase substrate binding protein (TIGR01987 family)
MNNPLDLTSLRNALAALEKSIGFLNSDLARNADLREQFRSAAVQAFEFTHELAFKMLKRQLRQMATHSSSVDQSAYMDIIRAGAAAGLIADVARFRDYREKRNLTSHTYDQSKAEQIEAVLPDFRDDVRFLLSALERLNRAND